MKHTFTHLDRTYTLDLIPAAGGFTVRCDGREYDLSIRDLRDGGLELTIDGRITVLHAAATGGSRWVALDGRTYELRRENRRRGRGGPGSPEGTLRAPMPGQVRAVNVSVGEEVHKGQTLLILEAMKMEIRIQSPCDGAVAALPAAVGQQVEREQVLVEIGS